MIRVGIVGGTGKLGKEILQLLQENKELQVGAVLARKQSPYIGMDARVLLDAPCEVGVPVTDDIIASRETCDIYIDCTHLDAFIESNYESYLAAGKPLIIATTGFGRAEHEDRLQRLSQIIPVLLCPNFSIGVYKFLKLVELAAREFGINSDIDILEIHHTEKKDCPSGTEVKMVQTIRDAGVDKDIPVHSMRSGDTVGEHTVMFATDQNERIEISHKLFSRKGLSQGVIRSVHWIISQQSGLYGLEDIYKE